MNCTICRKAIKLTPSAQERAAKYGGTPAHYINLFREHPACLIEKRSAEALALMRRIVREKTEGEHGPRIIPADKPR